MFADGALASVGVPRPAAAATPARVGATGAGKPASGTGALVPPSVVTLIVPVVSCGGRLLSCTVPTPALIESESGTVTPPTRYDAPASTNPRPLMTMNVPVSGSGTAVTTGTICTSPVPDAPNTATVAFPPRSSGSYPSVPSKLVKWNPRS